MKSFLELSEEKNKSLIMFFGRMNPPTKGHEEHINTLLKMAAKDNADYLIVASHSQDAKRNPLSPDTKLKHLKRAFPGTKITTSSKEKPTILHYASDAYKNGYTNLTVVAGDDRVQEFERLLKHFNGKFNNGEGFKFKKLQVLSTGKRKSGVSGEDMRSHAQNNDFKSFVSNLASNFQKNPQHAKDLFRDVRKGMGLNENKNRGLFKAIFVTGGPGSGKDIVIREAIAEQKAVEINSNQAFKYLSDKHSLAQKSNDLRLEAIRNRSPLIINGPADDHTRMLTVKEELEELGYSTMCIFVDTTNEASQARNEKLTKMIAESIRQEKWEIAQASKESYRQNFKNFINLNNSGSLNNIEEDITDIYENVNFFIDNKVYTETAYMWLESHNALNTNDSITVLVKENNNVKKDSRFIQRFKETRSAKLSSGTSGRAENFGDITPDNRAGDANADSIKWDAPKRTKSYTFRTYSESEEASLQKFSEPKESNFNKDKESKKRKGLKDIPTVNQRMRNQPGVGQEFDTRQQGTVYPMSGLGDVTYRESVKTFGSLIKEFNGFQNDVESGVGGTLGGSDNKEPMENPKNKVGYTYDTIRKRKNGAKK